MLVYFPLFDVSQKLAVVVCFHINSPITRGSPHENQRKRQNVNENKSNVITCRKTVLQYVSSKHSECKTKMANLTKSFKLQIIHKL